MNSPYKGQWRGALMFSLISAWINGWVNNREAGDLRRHRSHYDVIVMTTNQYLGILSDLMVRTISITLFTGGGVLAPILNATSGFDQVAFSTHWGRVTDICVSKLTIIGSDNGLSSGRRQVLIWTHAGIGLTGPLGTNLSDIVVEIQTFHRKKYIWICHMRNVVYFVPGSMC